MIVLCAHRLYTPREEIVNPLLFIEDGLIASISSRAEQEIPNAATVVDFNREDPHAILAPGFVDIHMHGGAGIDVMLAGTGELPRLNGFLTTHGVTGYFPTTVTAPLDQTYSALERLADAIETAQSFHTNMATLSRLFRWAFTWKVRFSVTSAAGCILRKIWLSPPWRYLTAFGRRLAVTCE